MLNMHRFERELRECRTAREQEHDARMICHARVAEELLKRAARRGTLRRMADGMRALWHAGKNAGGAIRTDGNEVYGGRSTAR